VLTRIARVGALRCIALDLRWLTAFEDGVYVRHQDIEPVIAELKTLRDAFIRQPVVDCDVPKSQLCDHVDRALALFAHFKECVDFEASVGRRAVSVSYKNSDTTGEGRRSG
jgi:hypothetical protein